MLTDVKNSELDTAILKSIVAGGIVTNVCNENSSVLHRMFRWNEKILEPSPTQSIASSLSPAMYQMAA